MGDTNFIWGKAAAALARIHPLFSTELNIGIGLVPSVVLLILVLWSVRRILVERDNDGRRAFLGAAVLSIAVMYLIGMRYWNGASPWHIVYMLVPGANGMRAISRYVLVLALPMSIAFAAVLNRTRLSPAMVLVAMFAIVEQFGRAPNFSAKAEMARLRSVAATLPPGCDAFYAGASPIRTQVKHEYQIDAMLISSITHVPTLNGYGGYHPPGWTLQQVEAPDYDNRVRQWIVSNHVTGNVCRLEIPD